MSCKSTVNKRFKVGLEIIRKLNRISVFSLGHRGLDDIDAT